MATVVLATVYFSMVWIGNKEREASLFEFFGLNTG